MTFSLRKSWTRAALGMLACFGLLTHTGRGQEPGSPRARVLVQDTGLPGIDRGLRDNDPPIDPDSRRSRSIRTQLDRPDATVTERLYIGGSIIVKFRSGASEQAVNSAMRVVKASALQRPSYADFEIMEIPAEIDPEVAAADLRDRPDVEYAQPRYRNHPMVRPNDPLYDRQWNFPAIDMERAWDIQPAAGNEITVAVLDTGVAFRTQMLRYENSRVPCRLEPGGPLFPPPGIVDVPFAVAPELGDGKFVAPRDFIWNDDRPFDLDGHGTHVSGTIGQLTNNGVGVAGMAYNVRIMPVKVIDDAWDCLFNSPGFGTDDTVARGIRYAADNGANVINMSIGRTTGGPAVAIEDAIRYAVTRGVFVSVAAGNSFDTGNAPNRNAEAAPSINGMMAVAAVGRALDRAYYSTTNTYVEIAAPGGDQRRDGTTGGVLQQTLDQALLHTYEDGPARLTPPRADVFAYYYWQGTSMATPHVSAFAAMLMQQGIRNPAAVEAAIKQFARDLGRAGVDNEYGYGLIQPRAALRGLGLAR
jgi:serine protease